jgi:hypothetical protein
LSLQGDSGKSQGINSKLCAASVILACYFKEPLGGYLFLVR